MKFQNTTEFNNIDQNFSKVSENDYFQTQQTLETNVASITTREMQQIDCIANKYYTNVDINDAFRIDAKPYVERPFFLEDISFSTSNSRYTLLNNSVKFLPGDVIRSNPSLLNAMKIGAYYRADLALNISMAGNITLAGTVLVAVLPPIYAFPTGDQKTLINSMLSSPHAFLNANEATSATIQCPWYCNSDMATLDMDNTSGYVKSLDLTTQNGNYGTLVYLVLNPLAPSTGSSTSISIVVEATFKNLDILVPTPRIVTWTSQSFVTGLFDMATDGLKKVAGDAIDAGRGLLREWTGLHNPNNVHIQNRLIMTQRNFPNVVDNEQFFEKLDPYADFNRVMQQPVFGTDVDEMSLDHIVSKKQMIGSFTVTTSDNVGKLYWVRPISPFQGGLGTSSDASGQISCVNNIELLHSLHRAWRGDLQLHIMSVMNNKQQVKLKVLKMYNPSVKSMTAYPDYRSIVNAPSHLLEFTQGGQEHIVDLPYLCRNDLTPCAEDMSFEAMFHGIYYIYLAQPLANSDGSPTSVEFNVFISGKPNLTFYGYVNKKLSPNKFNIQNNSARLIDDIFVPQSNMNLTNTGSIKVMNEPQKQQNTSSRDNKEASISHFDRLRPNLDLRPIMRRMYQCINGPIDVPASSSSYITVPLGALVGEIPPVGIFSPMDLISKMYYGKNVGFKINGRFTSIDTTGAPIPEVKRISVYYVPPNMLHNDIDQSVLGAQVNPAAIPELTTSYAIDQPPPLPYQVDPIMETANNRTFEFVIPDVTLYKFMGSPDKFRNFSSSYNNLSTADFGNVVFQIYNGGNDVFKGVFTLYFALTDESRFGFHSIAPPFAINKTKSIYRGTPTNPAEPTTAVLNPFLYKGTFL